MRFNMKRMFTRKLSVLLSALMVIGSLTLAPVSAADAPQETAAQSYGLPDSIEDGAILHAWCWSFNTIKEKLPQIAEAGYKSVQTSPINEVIKGENGGMQLYGKGKWYYQYQPISYNIGNYQLGTLDEFKEMCEEADKYGIKIIVDIVANHCSSNYSAISNAVKSLSGGAFHSRVEITDWKNRYQVTQGKLTGLYDLNTQNPVVQQMIHDYMDACLEAGADGFRFDAAKHIELPDEPPVNGVDFSSNFWNVILDNDAEFQYGEVLAGDNLDVSQYAKLMKITASAFGEQLRSGLSRNRITASLAKNLRVTGVDNSDLVTWVESHDNYADGTYSTIDDQMVRQGWALIAAQGDSTPLFFSRPAGSSTTNQWGKNTIGIAGNDNYFHPEVAEVNKFRNAMVGEDKTVTDITKNTSVLIQRGNKGAVIVNVATTPEVINTDVKLADGEYTDQVTGDSFTVKGGKLKGTVGAGAVAVIYIPEEKETESVIGDIDGDRKVTINDATALQRHLAEYKNEDGSFIVDESNPAAFEIADYDLDKRITIFDATAIQKYLAEFKQG